MKPIRPLLILCVLLLLVGGCKKEKDKEPSKTDLLVAHSWKDQNQTLRLNATEGTRTPATADVGFYQFGRDGKVTLGPANGTGAPGTTSTGTWSFGANESQLLITLNGSTETFELFELADSRLVFGYSYNQTQIQQAVNNMNNTTTLTLLLLSAGSFTFPAGTATIPTSQLTSVVYKFNTVPR
jgi:hypothetical protein